MECAGATFYNEDGFSDILSEKYVVAKKQHKCSECRRVIEVKEKYFYEFGIFEGESFVSKTCLDCKSIRDTFFKNGFIYGEINWMLSDYIQDIDGDVPSSCIISLINNAKDRVFEIIERGW